LSFDELYAILSDNWIGATAVELIKDTPFYKNRLPQQVLRLNLLQH